jgi:GntR family transcriptional regulator/MocR family aminotransferase
VDIFSSTLYQAVLTDFIREGHFARHIRRMRMLYMERRNALIAAIEEHIGDGLDVVSAEAGMHLVGLLRRGVEDAVVSARAAKVGISAEPLSMCYLRKPAASRGGLILGYGGIDVEQIQAGVRKLAGVLRMTKTG